MFKKLFYMLAICSALIFTQTSDAAAIETQNSFYIANVELDTELRDRANLPFLRDKDNKPLTEKTGTERAKTLIGQVIGIVLQFLIGISVILIIINGFKFITAGGDESKLSEAKKSLGILIGGLLLIFFSYSIVSFVFKTVLFVEELKPILDEQSTEQPATTPSSSTTTTSSS
jgi:hypothetical protein